MFLFNRVINAVTGVQYCISSASLACNEYDFTRDGGNSYQIDLEPLDDNNPGVYGLTLSMSNDGNHVRITKNMDKETSTYESYSRELQMDVKREEMQDCIVCDKTLVVRPDVIELALQDLVKHAQYPVSEDAVNGMTLALSAIVRAENRGEDSADRMAELVSDCFATWDCEF